MTSRRFAILEHDHPFRHWDLLIEDGDHAVCWRLLRPPLIREWIAAERLPDHRLLYLDYEGPVSGNRGQVKRFGNGIVTSSAWDAGGSTSQPWQVSGTVAFTSIERRRTPDGREFFLFH